MTRNTSAAVMQQRHEPHDSLDDFPTAPWATRALCEWLRAFMAPGPLASVREPAANRGYMARPLGEYFADVRASDIHDYGAGYPLRDYLLGPLPERTWLTATNPPFRLAAEFILRALESSDHVAVFVRSAFLEGADRYRELFSDHPPTDMLQFCERVVLWKGVLLDPDVPIARRDEKTGEVLKIEKPTTATSYVWLIWRRGGRGLNSGGLHFIPPGTRKRLTRPGDYPPVPDHLKVPEVEPAPAPLLDAMGGVI